MSLPSSVPTEMNQLIKDRSFALGAGSQARKRSSIGVAAQRNVSDAELWERVQKKNSAVIGNIPASAVASRTPAAVSFDTAKASSSASGQSSSFSSTNDGNSFATARLAFKNQLASCLGRASGPPKPQRPTDDQNAETTASSAELENEPSEYRPRLVSRFHKDRIALLRASKISRSRPARVHYLRHDTSCSVVDDMGRYTRSNSPIAYEDHAATSAAASATARGVENKHSPRQDGGEHGQDDGQQQLQQRGAEVGKVAATSSPSAPAARKHARQLPALANAIPHHHHHHHRHQYDGDADEKAVKRVEAAENKDAEASRHDATKHEDRHHATHGVLNKLFHPSHHLHDDKRQRCHENESNTIENAKVETDKDNALPSHAAKGEADHGSSLRLASAGTTARDSAAAGANQRVAAQEEAARKQQTEEHEVHAGKEETAGMGEGEANVVEVPESASAKPTRPLREVPQETEEQRLSPPASQHVEGTTHTTTDTATANIPETATTTDSSSTAATTTTPITTTDKTEHTSSSSRSTSWGEHVRAEIMQRLSRDCTLSADDDSGDNGENKGDGCGGATRGHHKHEGNTAATAAAAADVDVDADADDNADDDDDVVEEEEDDVFGQEEEEGMLFGNNNALLARQATIIKGVAGTPNHQKFKEKKAMSRRYGRARAVPPATQEKEETAVTAAASHATAKQDMNKSRSSNSIAFIKDSKGTARSKTPARQSTKKKPVPLPRTSSRNLSSSSSSSLFRQQPATTKPTPKPKARGLMSRVLAHVSPGRPTKNSKEDTDTASQPQQQQQHHHRFPMPNWKWDLMQRKRRRANKDEANNSNSNNRQEHACAPPTTTVAATTTTTTATLSPTASGGEASSATCKGGERASTLQLSASQLSVSCNDDGAELRQKLDRARRMAESTHGRRSSSTEVDGCAQRRSRTHFRRRDHGSMMQSLHEYDDITQEEFDALPPWKQEIISRHRRKQKYLRSAQGTTL